MNLIIEEKEFMALPMEKPDGGLIEFPKQNQTQNITLTAAELQRLIREAVKQSKTKTEKPKPTRSRYKTNGIRKAHKAEPLYNAEQFNVLGKYILNSGKKYALRDYMMLVFGCTVGDRGSDLLNAKLYEVLNADGTVRDYYETYEQKTGKLNRNKLTENCKLAIKNYVDSLSSYNMDDYLIKSQKNGKMTIQRMWAILNEYAEGAGLTQNIGTHTLRKTYGYSARRVADGDSVMDLLQAKYKHSDQRVTKTYLTITQDEIDELADKIDEELFK